MPVEVRTEKGAFCFLYAARIASIGVMHHVGRVNGDELGSLYWSTASMGCSGVRGGGEDLPFCCALHFALDAACCVAWLFWWGNVFHAVEKNVRPRATRKGDRCVCVCV